ncbi:MAG: single-stranded-DNA-specific exonuclease RecJ [Candidatus Peregrinibacteria bacterium]
MSVLNKKWVVKNTDLTKDTLQKVMENRNFDKEEKILHDPFLFEHMQKATDRIAQAIKNDERIIIFGDYDVDGITGTTILYKILSQLKVQVSCRLPNRAEDGYGLSEKFIKDFEENDIKLVITTDCGISNEKTIKKLKEKNIDTIITDHHTIPKTLPKEAVAIIHPALPTSKYPFKDLTGAGVALKLAQALIQKYFPKPQHKALTDQFLDLACLGTVADLGPITGENWVIVKEGLKNIHNTKWTGLKKIISLSESKGKIDTTTIGYRIAPRINAAGRIADPYLALNLLIQEQESNKTNILGSKLESLNHERKDLTMKALFEAEDNLKKHRVIPYIIIDRHPNWHVGILGLIAGNLAEKYTRPSIMMQDLGDMLVASARSIPSFNIIEALTKHKKYLESFGGHAQAAGFSIKKKNLAPFTKEITAYTKQKLKSLDLKQILPIDCEIFPQEIDKKLLTKLETLAPFGTENTRPIFLLQNLTPTFIDTVGKEKSHLKFSVQLREKTLEVIAFRMGGHANSLRKHKKIDLVVHIEENKWNGKSIIQLQALDFRESKQ